MENKLSICAVIISYEPDEQTIRLIDSIDKQVSEIVIVDNFSRSESSKAVLKTLADRSIKIIYNDGNYGVAKALNQGVEYALSKKYEWILTLDQDSEFYPNTYDLLLQGYETLENKDMVMLIAPKPVERNFLKDCATPFNVKNSRDIRWKNTVLNLTSGSLIKAEAFGRIGFFEEKLFIEQVDNDFCCRLGKKGYGIKVASNIRFMHKLGNASKKLFFTLRNHNPKRKYYLARNSAYIFKKHFFYAPYTTIRCLLGGTILGWIKILLFEDSKTDKIRSGIKGFIDGVMDKY